ncbi:MAG: 3-dehydroquinate dehydratase [Crocinitomicaceae bacterium]|jgi:3-dehydroquinate dehydratase-2|nr:3-dehydroquinate dehydratase [Crocinitomicaceae bacterium]MDA9881645.1 3-dehydroquinate dehydratase [Crocinitomicaceae bacterium]MDG1036653.1 3-dehydroquinate dehydratase [Crocinitomicaceae bacterium]MDG1742880.1 3-dehydroquinate dehydratase [Crocinitomicaceae bacterium]
MRLLIVNGPNLNFLGQREEQIYGNESFTSYFERMKSSSAASLEYVQSNIEGELINILQGSDHDAIVFNAGGYTHTSVAIRDCIEAITVPVVEVHISNIASRESFRHTSLLSPVAEGCIFGFGLQSYDLAVDYCMNYLNKR